MSLKEGSKTIVNQCLKIQEGEKVVLVNDNNDQELIESLKETINEQTDDLIYIEYPEPETSGTEPPEAVVTAFKNCDVFIAPTLKSLSHTQARIKAVENGARGSTLPGVNKEIWTSSLLADYNKVKEISEKAYSYLEDGQEIHITTPSGTDLTFEVRLDSFFTDTGIVHESGKFSNLPAGEVHGGVITANGTVVVDHFPFAPSGTKVEIKDSQVVSIQHPEGVEDSELAQAFENNECAKNVAEFGFGTNPEATLIGNILQDEKVLGTVHIAFGDNSHYFPEDHERHTQCNIHWDTVCENPTVTFGDKVMLENGEPRFMD